MSSFTRRIRRRSASREMPAMADMGQIQVAVEPPSAWSLMFEGFDPAQAGICEVLCTPGNGYFATRSAAAGARADGIHYPGTYLAGGYNRLRTDIAGRSVENEDMVNCPNWLAPVFRIGGEDWFDARSVKPLAYRQERDLRLDLRVRYRGHSLDLRLTRDALRVRGRDGAAAPISLCVGDKVCEFISGTSRVFRLGDAATVQTEI
jgi:trehalose/maltose hydrolase-like predicted phosphorylase